MADAKSEYNVVFRYNSRAAGYEGVITWSTYPSNEVFDAQYRCSFVGDKCIEEIVEEGVTPERAIELCQSTPLVSRLRASLQEATNPNTNEVDDEILRMNLIQVFLAERII